jgi:hypothetical protein
MDTDVSKVPAAFNFNIKVAEDGLYRKSTENKMQYNQFSSRLYPDPEDGGSRFLQQKFNPATQHLQLWDSQI